MSKSLKLHHCQDHFLNTRNTKQTSHTNTFTSYNENFHSAFVNSQCYKTIIENKESISLSHGRIAFDSRFRTILIYNVTIYMNMNDPEITNEK